MPPTHRFHERSMLPAGGKAKQVAAMSIDIAAEAEAAAVADGAAGSPAFAVVD